MVLSCPWGGLGWALGRISTQENAGCGTECHGLPDKVVFSHRLDPVIPEVFSNLDGSVILLKLLLTLLNSRFFLLSKAGQNY